MSFKIGKRKIEKKFHINYKKGLAPILFKDMIGMNFNSNKYISGVEGKHYLNKREGQLIV